jgi:hypothetical protein
MAGFVVFGISFAQQETCKRRRVLLSVIANVCRIACTAVHKAIFDGAWQRYGGSLSFRLFAHIEAPRVEINLGQPRIGEEDRSLSDNPSPFELFLC